MLGFQGTQCPIVKMKLSIKSSYITTSGANNDWCLEIQNEQMEKIVAVFPNLNDYVILIDGEPIIGNDTVSRVFSMSAYNIYECVLWKTPHNLIVDSIVVKNSLLDGEVVHHISVVRK